MRISIVWALIVAALILSCGSIPGSWDDAAVDIATDAASSTTSSTKTGSVSTGGGGLAFKDGEILAAQSGNKATDATYLVATILTPAGSDTKNEAEVMFVKNGETRWTSLVIPTHPAEAEELQPGMWVFAVYASLASFGDITADEFRNDWWYVGRVVETDELYKGIVQVGKNSYKLEGIRVPDEPL